MGHLASNKIHPDQAAYQQIKEHFESSTTSLRDLERRIELTDDLIDRIVYRLYGLTEEEVALVEKGLGKAGQEAEEITLA